MTGGRRFCGKCGTPVGPAARFCPGCGAPAALPSDLPQVAGSPPAPLTSPDTPSRSFPAASPSSPSPPSSAPVTSGGPATLAALIRMIAGRVKKNSGRMIKGMIMAVAVSFAIVLLLHAILLMMNPGGSDLAATVLAPAGLQSSANALLFWFLLTAILAFAWGQVQARGLVKALGKLGTLPAWIGGAARTTGISAVPLVMGGMAVALVLRLYLLSVLTGLQFLILLTGILYSQQESIAVLALSLGYSDLHRMVRGGPAIPAPGLPVMGVLGACAGFVLVLFVEDSLLLAGAAVVLMIAGAMVVLLRKRPRAQVIP